MKTLAEREVAALEIREYQVAEEHRDNVLRNDLRSLMESAEGRRLFRRLLGPEFTNYWGHNSESRTVGCELARVLDTAVNKAMQTLFEKQEEDEHGWH